MTTYVVVIPANQSTKREFSSLRGAKRYARSLARGTFMDDRAIIQESGFSSRFARIKENGHLDYTSCPDSWRRA